MKETKIIAYKGFDENLCCKRFQYEVGKEYEQEGEIVCCRNGFHACANPFDVLKYYFADCKNRFCIVEQSGIIMSDNEDSKQSSSKIKIIEEIGVADLLNAGVEWIKEKTNPDKLIKSIKGKENIESGDSVQIGSIDDYSLIGLNDDHAKIDSSGFHADIVSSGDFSQISSSGAYAKIVSSGDYARIDSSGFHAKIVSSGDFANIGSSDEYARIVSIGNYTQIFSSSSFDKITSSGKYNLIAVIGDNAKIVSSGYSAEIVSRADYAQIVSSGRYDKICSVGSFAYIYSIGHQACIASAGEDSVICCSGNNSIVKAKKGSCITLSEWKYSAEKRRCVPGGTKTEFVDGKRIKEDTWYKLVDGEFKEQ